MGTELFSIAKGLTRGYPTFIVFASLLYSVLYADTTSFFFGIYLFLSDELNHLTKEYIAKPIFGNKKLPILGYGKRPYPNAISSMFPPDTPSRSYGMPSGHAQIASVFSSYWSFKIWEDEERDENMKLVSITLLIGLALLVMYSRVYWMKCHTVQQVVLGGAIGTALGYAFYAYKDLFMNKEIKKE